MCHWMGCACAQQQINYIYHLLFIKKHLSDSIEAGECSQIARCIRIAMGANGGKFTFAEWNENWSASVPLNALRFQNIWVLHFRQRTQRLGWQKKKKASESETKRWTKTPADSRESSKRLTYSGMLCNLYLCSGNIRKFGDFPNTCSS